MSLPERLWLDLCITLRCNAACPNCIKLCNAEAVTGLDYADSDMTLGQIDEFIRQCKEVDTRRFFFTVTVTGGEPLLHPEIAEIMTRLHQLQVEDYISDLVINSNKLIKNSPAEGKILNFSEPHENHSIHNCVYLHPSDCGGQVQTYDSCQHYRKHTLILNYLGYCLCCAGDPYIRLFGYEDLIVENFPAELPIKGMDKVCQHCPFGDEAKVPFERDLGRPVSEIYKQEAEKNRAGRQITKRFPELQV